MAALAHLREALAHSPLIGVPPSAVHKCIKPRKPRSGNEIALSSFRPIVLAHDHLHSFHSSILEELPLADVLKLFDNYGAGLLHFHQYCDSRSIPENNRMPASDHLLASFIASWARKVAAMMAQNWLAGLHFWHNLHGAPWFGHSLSKVVPDSSKCPRQPPVMLDHIHALFCRLDLSNAFDMSMFAVTCVTFWCCCRLGELVIDSVSSFDPVRHVSRSTKIRHHALQNQIPFIVFHIPWTKTTHGDGTNIVASKIDDLTNPVTALNHHLSANSAIPPTAPFFTYETARGGWMPMTRPWFLAHCNWIWRDAWLLELMGHCFRIGGASELLLRGIPLDVVAMQGHWKSRAFLDYWCKIESILPLFVTSSFMDARISLIHSLMDLYARRYK
ncbi:DNA breaking-rejoining enzyme [Suillus tomentosus]|nr:DNA breaking-rejoining enzyme [Suillus tomentosus]